MCGRYALYHEYHDIAAAFNLSESVAWQLHYNIAPGATSPIIISPYNICFMEWGWKMNMGAAGNTTVINARAETIKAKNYFKDALTHRRCIIMVSGYYEWRLIGRDKQPFLFTAPQGQPFGIAGIYQNDSFVLITTVANQSIKAVHDRMPLVIAKEHYMEWLHQGKQALELLQTVPMELSYRPVSTVVNKASYDSPMCIKSLN